MSTDADIAAEGIDSEGEDVGMCGVRGDVSMLTGAPDITAEGNSEGVDVE